MLADPPKETPANTENKPANDVFDGLLTEFAAQLAKKMGVSNQAGAAEGIVSKIRWYPNKAGAIVIVKRGADRTVLATISPKKGDWSHLYPSWQKALQDLEAQKLANGVSRLSHKGLATGEMPVLAEKGKA